MRKIGRIALTAAALAIVLPGAELPAEAQPVAQPLPAVPSRYRVRTLISGLDHPWDVAFRPNRSMFVTEREGWIGLWRNGHYRRILRPRGLVSNGEGGMLGIAVSPRFRRNRRVFVCFNTARDVRVVRFTFARHPVRLIRRRNIVTGIPANPSGRHSGCRPRFGPDGFLWVTTGDAAHGTHPQDLNSLGGKVLRVTEWGRRAPRNFRGRIFAYGFRNPQGISFRPGDGRAFIVEHGPDRDDEITPLRRGGNGGWNPVGNGETYNEDVPMTDTQRYPHALRPVWQSGDSTIAPSGGTFVTHRDWGTWRGRMAVAVLKDQHLRLIDVRRGVADPGRIIVSGQGRLRTAVEGPRGLLYIPVDADPGRIITVNPLP
jgi:aldose sugar dehydrogenase